MEQDNELLLFDRVNVIKDTIKKYGEENFYLSFSGGKDSTMLHYLLDMALPNNRIPRVFINTGVEYQAIVNFVADLAQKDDRFIMLKPTKPIIKTLEEYGYPFKSKQHSHDLAVYQHSGINNKTTRKYLGIDEGKNIIKCPKCLKYQFSENGLNFKVSDLCCMKMKKDPIKKWEKESGHHIGITGMRKSEGGQRMKLESCILTDKDGNLKRFHPLVKINDDFEQFFVDKIERERERVEYFANSIIRLITSVGRVAKAVLTASIWNINLRLWKNYYQMNANNANSFGSLSMTSIVE